VIATLAVSTELPHSAIRGLPDSPKSCLQTVFELVCAHCCGSFLQCRAVLLDIEEELHRTDALNAEMVLWNRLFRELAVWVTLPWVVGPHWEICLHTKYNLGQQQHEKQIEKEHEGSNHQWGPPLRIDWFVRPNDTMGPIPRIGRTEQHFGLELAASFASSRRQRQYQHSNDPLKADLQ
jgi:hypothetical protein